MGPFNSSRIAFEETLEKAACIQKTASSKGKISKRFSMKFSKRGELYLYYSTTSRTKAKGISRLSINCSDQTGHSQPGDAESCFKPIFLNFPSFYSDYSFQNMNLILMIQIVNTFFNCVVNISGLDLTALYLYAGNHDECLR